MPWKSSERHAAGTLLLIAALAAPAPAQEPAATPEPLTLAAAMRLALATSPDVLAAQKALQAARAGIGVARQRPNPELTLERAKETPHDSATFDLPLETGGKRRRRVELAEASTRLAEAELLRATLEVRLQVRRAYFSLVAAERQAGLREQQEKLATRVRDAAQARFESGDRPRLDLAQAALALAQSEVDADGARGSAAASRAVLDALLGRPTEAPIVLADALEGGVLPPAPALTTLALGSSAELSRLQQQVEEQQARLALARSQQVPDLTLAPAVTHDSPPEFDWGWRAAVTLVLPLFHNHRAEVEVEQRTLEQRQAELAAARRRIAGELARTQALAESAQRSARLYRDQIVPQTEEVERMAEDAYRSGQTGVEALLLALQAARETRFKAIQAAIDYQNALADLEQAVGAPLP
ncbi:MAG TPA: TolC family protein [Thermoanaerobaculia bacterium]|jgi:cobalt-zinc-cadmium efflux system outer membrane protein|nr:TolC family protein [Thermoanaerobaculia bacterium]